MKGMNIQIYTGMFTDEQLLSGLSHVFKVDTNVTGEFYKGFKTLFNIDIIVVSNFAGILNLKDVDPTNQEWNFIGDDTHKIDKYLSVNGVHDDESTDKLFVYYTGGHYMSIE